MECFKCNLTFPFVIGFPAALYASLNTRLGTRSVCLRVHNVSEDDKHFN